MQTRWVTAVAAGLLLVGVALGVARVKGEAGMKAISGKSAADAAAAALIEAERLAGKGSWERIAIGRVCNL